MSVGDVFVDTNVLLYVHDRHDPAKARASASWLAALSGEGRTRINLQVLNELTHVLLRKRWFEHPEIVHRIVDDFAAMGERPLTRIEVERARRLHATLGFSWWDCLLLASALELGCTHFLSEDLQDG